MCASFPEIIVISKAQMGVDGGPKTINQLMKRLFSKQDYRMRTVDGSLSSF